MRSKDTGAGRSIVEFLFECLLDDVSADVAVLFHAVENLFLSFLG